MRPRRLEDLPLVNALPQAYNHPPANPAGGAVQPTIAPTRWMVVPNIPILAAGAVSPTQRLDFGGGAGWIVGMRGITFDTVAATSGQFEQACTTLRAFFNTGEELFTNGQGLAFASFGTIFTAGVQWSPMLRRVSSTDVLNFQFQNISPGGTFQPALSLGFIRDGDFIGHAG